MALITAAEAREHLHITGTDEDALLTILIGVAGEAMARFCRYPAASAGAAPTMESTSYTQRIDGPGGRDLTFPVWPLTAISSIYDDPTLDYSDAAYLVASADYAIIDGSEGLIRLASTSSWGNWSTGIQHIEVQATAGYATPREDLKYACRVAVRKLWDLRSTQGKESVSQRGTSTTYSEPAWLPIETQMALWGYVLPVGLI